MKSISFFLVLAAFLLLFSQPSAEARTEEEVNNYLNQTIIPDFQSNTTAADALAILQKQLSLNRWGIYYDLANKGKLQKTAVKIHLSNVSGMQVIAAICAAANVKFVIKKDQIRIFEPWMVQQGYNP